MKNKSYIFRYGLMKRFRRGIKLKIYPTFACNVGCDYCGMKLSHDKGFVMPKKKTVELQDWLDFIDNFPEPIQEIVVTGGEPTLWPHFTGLVNSLLDKGYYVLVQTTLADLSKFFHLYQSRRLRFAVSYHHGKMDKDELLEKYNLLSKIFVMHIEEIGYQELPFSRLKQFVDIDHNEVEKPGERWVSPDLKVYKSLLAMTDDAKE